MRLLLVEDNPADARLIREMLKDSPVEDFQIQHVARLDSALELVGQEMFDSVLLDLGLPDSQGLRTLALMQRGGGGLPIVILTGFDDERFALEAVRAGAQDYLVKGRFERELLVRTIRHAVQRNRAEKTIRRLNAELERRVAERTAQLQAANDELLKLTAESERRQRLYETVLSNTPDLVYVFDLNHRFSYANDSLLRMWGRTWDEAIGKNCLELGYEPWHAAMHDREIEQVIATKQPIKGEVPFSGTYGRRIYEYIFVPVLGNDGTAEAVAGTTRDVTEHRQSEETLHQLAQHRQLALDAARLGWWHYDPATGVVTWDERYKQIFGVAGYERHAEGLLARLHPDDVPSVWAAVEAALNPAAAKPFSAEYRIFHEDGSVRWVEAHGIASFEAEGEARHATSLVGTAQDITERRQAEQALIRTEKLASVGRLAASIAHEVNNPLAAATNAVFIASADPGLSGQTRDVLQLADQELRRAAYITGQTLGFCRETNSRHPVSLPKLIDEVVGVFARKLRDRGITVERRYKCGPCREGCEVCFVANASELRQVISNLLVNGMDAIRDNGTMHVRLCRMSGFESGPKIRLTIADNGCGIRAENLKRIFEPFFTTKESLGTGLGLWISQEIVRKYDGSIRMRSQKDKGTVFCITVPAMHIPPASERGSAPKSTLLA